MVHRIGGLTCLLGAVMTAGAAFAGPPSVAPVQEAVSIYLRPSVTLVGPVVTVGDVAAMEGGTGAYRRRFAALDLADLSSVAPELEITREQIAFRLRLAGAGVNQFRLLGAKHTRAHLGGGRRRRAGRRVPHQAGGGRRAETAGKSRDNQASRSSSSSGASRSSATDDPLRGPARRPGRSEDPRPQRRFTNRKSRPRR